MSQAMEPACSSVPVSIQPLSPDSDLVRLMKTVIDGRHATCTEGEIDGK